MTEAEWLRCTDPERMLEFLGRKADPRKLRLFAAACARRLSRLLDDQRSLRALDMTERYADRGKKRSPSHKELRQAELDAWAVGHALNAGPDYARYNAARAAMEAASPVAALAAQGAAISAAHAICPASGPERTVERVPQAGLLHCVFGNPFQPVTIAPTWLTSPVVSLAQAAYDNRSLPAGTLEPARLAILGDALEEAGCNNADLLNHLRGPGPHVRGCWALDLLWAKK